ncbi:MAG: hypothetical protein AB8B74_13635 [Crocinitomicaceae bacterium]
MKLFISVFILAIARLTLPDADNFDQQEPIVIKNCGAGQMNKVISFKDNISNGVFIHDLSWAWNSSVACFPETQKQSFTGKHILFQTEIPAKSEMTITLKPSKRNAKLSLYGYQVGVNSTVLVPNLSSCVSCEADNNQSQNATNNSRSISFRAVNRPYKIVIGIAGENGLDSGEFTFDVSVKNR